MNLDDIKIIDSSKIGINEIWLQVEINGVEYSGCLSEIQD